MRKIVLVAPNAGEGIGGEAIKVLQYFDFLLSAGVEVDLVTHARSRPRLGLRADSPCVHFVEDGPWQRALWRSRVLVRGLDPVFHLAAARLIRERFDLSDSLIHYLCPISPVEPRFPPRGAVFALGPLNAAGSYPPAFRGEEGRLAQLEHAATGTIQGLSRVLTGEKRAAEAVLVSGGARTEASLLAAGARPDRIVHVVDSGVSDRFFAPRVPHEGRDGRFYASGRLIPFKGFDMAVEAVARTPEVVTLDLIGDGPERGRLEALARRFGVEDRVRFLGWLPNSRLAERIRGYRGMVFPSLREANGIVMQEAMAAGTPVVALRWAGPAALADDEAAVYVEPESREAVIDGFARGMTMLAENADAAECIAAAARTRAERDFRWEAVAMSWLRACGLKAEEG